MITRSKCPTPKRASNPPAPGLVSSINPNMVGYVQTYTRPDLSFSVTSFTGLDSGRCCLNAFKQHLPESSPVNLVTEKDKSGRVYVCTYPTMLGLIDETKPGAGGFEARFGVGHFDLVIIDEAHRSVYQKFGAIFRYFDSLLVGLTATPREQVDRNTYQLFGLQPGVPTDAYELQTAVDDGFLVPPKAIEVNLKFPGRGIVYDDLSEAEKDEWEST